MKLLELPHNPRGAAEFGGKAANLARLRAAGFQVPKTWVLQGLGDSPEMPARAPSAVALALRSLLAGSPALIIRSSASVEDGSGVSFAGQFASFRTTTVEDAWRAICASVESQAGSSALAYADALQVPTARPRPGVIVQPFVEPRYSGIGFTQGADTVVIEAIRGHNELLVGGLVTPERFLFRGEDVAHTPGDQQLFAFAHPALAFPADLVDAPFGAGEAYVVEYDEASGTVYAAIPELAASPVLSPGHALELKNLLLEVRSAFDFDIDVEWVFDNSFTLVQARPVTRPPLGALPDTEHEEGQNAGQCASPGYAEAPALVAADRDLINSLPAGHILVSQATSPEHTPALLRAAGVVTEQGGLLSHTAIVCRELGIPCIVGRPQATQELRTGQVVKLDAAHLSLIPKRGPLPSQPHSQVSPRGRPVLLVTDANRAGADALLIAKTAHPRVPTFNPSTSELTIAGRTLSCSVEPGKERPGAQACLSLLDHRAYLEVSSQ